MIRQEIDLVAASAGPFQNSLKTVLDGRGGVAGVDMLIGWSDWHGWGWRWAELRRESLQRRQYDVGAREGVGGRGGQLDKKTS